MDDNGIPNGSRSRASSLNFNESDHHLQFIPGLLLSASLHLASLPSNHAMIQPLASTKPIPANLLDPHTSSAGQFVPSHVSHTSDPDPGSYFSGPLNVQSSSRPHPVHLPLLVKPKWHHCQGSRVFERRISVCGCGKLRTIFGTTVRISPWMTAGSYGWQAIGVIVPSHSTGASRGQWKRRYKSKPGRD